MLRRPPAWLTPLTAMFTHDGLLHLAGNMLFLWIFGRTVENALGSLRFLAFYVLAGLAATALLVALGPDSDVPSIGAAGAIGGVVGGYLILFPRARMISLAFMLFFVTIVAVPALVYRRPLGRRAGAVRPARRHLDRERAAARATSRSSAGSRSACWRSAVRPPPRRVGVLMRTVILVLALLFIAIFAFLTLYVLLWKGPDVLVVVSLVVLGMFAFGVIGALSTPPRDG